MANSTHPEDRTRRSLDKRGGVFAPRTHTFDDTEPAVYVASLSDYNAGRLHGVWVNPGLEDINEAVADMLAKSPEPIAEEWRIDDHMSWGGYRVSEWEDFDTLATMPKLLPNTGTLSRPT